MTIDESIATHVHSIRQPIQSEDALFDIIADPVVRDKSQVLLLGLVELGHVLAWSAWHHGWHLVHGVDVVGSFRSCISEVRNASGLKRPEWMLCKTRPRTIVAAENQAVDRVESEQVEEVPRQRGDPSHVHVCSVDVGLQKLFEARR